MRRIACVVASWALFWAGCIPPISPTTPLPTAKDIEPNNDITQAVALTLDGAGRAGVSGSVEPSDDIDVYDLGPVEPGDRVRVEVRAVGGSLDPLAALFNTDLDMINYNDDEDYEGNRLDSVIDHIVRHATDHCYLAVTSSGFSPSTGSYTIDVQVTRDGTVPDPQGQTVLLDFDGATVRIPGDATYNIGAFDPGRVDSRLAGRDDEIQQRVQDVLEDRYSAYDIDFITADDPAFNEDDEYSRLVFGGESITTFGIAQSIDHYNEDIADEAIIFTDYWTRPFSHTPTVDSIVTSIGNVAAHEFGHLLGLEHTADIIGLMDSSGTADTILVPQDFKLSPLYGQVFPFGWQDAPQLLLDTIGPAGN